MRNWLLTAPDLERVQTKEMYWPIIFQHLNGMGCESNENCQFSMGKLAHWSTVVYSSTGAIIVMFDPHTWCIIRKTLDREQVKSVKYHLSQSSFTPKPCLPLKFLPKSDQKFNLRMDSFLFYTIVENILQLLPQDSSGYIWHIYLHWDSIYLNKKYW